MFSVIDQVRRKYNLIYLLSNLQKIINTTYKEQKDIWTQTQEFASLDVISHSNVDVDELGCLEDISNHEPGTFLQLWNNSYIGHETNAIPFRLSIHVISHKCN